MKSEYYLSDEIFSREQQVIFRRLWIFIGLKTMLSNHNDFVARKIAGVPVVVQNFQGELRAFENICLHRQAALQCEEFGRRPLVCRYHGWGYNKEGRPENIPLCEEIYRFGEAERDGLKLREFSLQSVGNLVFINLAGRPITIEEQFSAEFLESLRSSSEAYDSEVIVARISAKFNWKLAYENLRDSNHPRYVHASTLAKQVDFRAVIDEEGHVSAQMEILKKNHSREERMDSLRGFSFGGADTPLRQLVPFDWHNYVERFGELDYYYNWLAYPNLHIASGSGGYSFTIEQHIPISPDRTDLIVYWMMAKKTRRYSASAAVLHAHMIGGRPVLAEDIRIMETVQAGLHAEAPLPMQGDYEYRNRLVEHWYADLMEEKFDL